MAQTLSDSPDVTVIAPSKGLGSLKLKELWRYRELVYFLIWRDVKVKYKQTLLGAFWAILQPFGMMVVFTLFFGRLAKIPSDGLPYPIFSYVGLLPWTYFATSIQQSADSLVGGRVLVTRVYFPRLALPLASVMAPLVDFGIAFVILLGMMVYYGVTPTPAVLLLPAFLLLALMTALGAGLWLSALNVHYRDVRFALPFLTQMLLFATPVVYPSSLLSEPWRTLYGLNPMAGVVEGFRWALLGSQPPGPMLWVSVGASVLLLAGGLLYFRRMERTFADVV